MAGHSPRSIVLCCCCCWPTMAQLKPACASCRSSSPDAAVPPALLLHDQLVCARSKHLLQLLGLRPNARLPCVEVCEQVASDCVVMHHHTPAAAATRPRARRLCSKHARRGSVSSCACADLGLALLLCWVINSIRLRPSGMGQILPQNWLRAATACHQCAVRFVVLVKHTVSVAGALLLHCCPRRAYPQVHPVKPGLGSLRVAATLDGTLLASS